MLTFDKAARKNRHGSAAPCSKRLPRAMLGQRQIEVIRHHKGGLWKASGLTALEQAELMRIAHKTQRSHVEAVCFKVLRKKARANFRKADIDRILGRDAGPQG